MGGGVGWGCYLEVRAGDAGCNLFEEGLLDPDELGGLDHIQDLLDLPQEHHLNSKTRQVFVSKTFYFFRTTRDI